MLFILFKAELISSYPYFLPLEGGGVVNLESYLIKVCYPLMYIVVFFSRTAALSILEYKISSNPDMKKRKKNVSVKIRFRPYCF